MTQRQGVGVVGSGVSFLDSNPGSDWSRRTVVPIHMPGGDMRCYVLSGGCCVGRWNVGVRHMGRSVAHI